MITIDGVSHIGIRVVDAARSAAFHRLLRFEPVWCSSPLADVAILTSQAHG